MLSIRCRQRKGDRAGRKGREGEIEVRCSVRRKEEGTKRKRTGERDWEKVEMHARKGST
jgi:hypothetical protein